MEDQVIFWRVYWLLNLKCWWGYIFPISNVNNLLNMGLYTDGEDWGKNIFGQEDLRFPVRFFILWFCDFSSDNEEENIYQNHL